MSYFDNVRQLYIGKADSLPYDSQEAMNRVRVYLELCGSQYKSILITSSIPYEGKSTLAFNLWRLLAETGKRTVYIDADIRGSQLRTRHRMAVADGGAATGLVSYLAGQSELYESVYETNIPNAYIVPVFKTMVNPAVLLQTPLFTEMIQELKESFDSVIIDTPPLTNVADGMQIAANCDGALFVVRGDYTPRPLVARSIQQLKTSGCELLGVVLNAMEMKTSPYYGRYSRCGYSRRKYGYGYGYGHEYGNATRRKKKK